jgi:LmbE family N-acetylglucosaminyl deacetylase
MKCGSPRIGTSQVATSTWSRARLRPLVRLASSLAEQTFTSTAGLAGYVAVPRVTDWSSSGGQRILVVAPHPDDEIVGCGGTIIRHLTSGDEATILYATDGSASRALGLGPDEMRIRRHDEAQAACRVIGVNRTTWLGLDERDWQTDELVSALTDLLDKSPPDVVYTPSRIDFHPDHQRVAHAVAVALHHHLPTSIAVRAYQIQVPLTGVLINLVADVSIHAERIKEALAKYVTQQATIASTVRLRRYQSAYFHRREVEVFWETTADRFVSLHLEPPSHGSASFRGLHPRAFMDPLAFWSARGKRRACR